MTRKIVFLLLIAAATADQTTPRSEDETQPEKRSVPLALKAYNAVGNQIANVGYLATYGYLPDPVPVQAPLADPEQTPLADPAQAPVADPMPVAPPVPEQRIFVPQPAPVPRVYIQVEKKVPVYVKVPYAVPRFYPVTIEKHVPVPYNKLVPYPVVKSVPVNKLVPYPVPQYMPPYKYVFYPQVYAPYHQVVVVREKSKKHLIF